MFWLTSVRLVAAKIPETVTAATGAVNVAAGPLKSQLVERIEELVPLQFDLFVNRRGAALAETRVACVGEDHDNPAPVQNVLERLFPEIVLVEKAPPFPDTLSSSDLEFFRCRYRIPSEIPVYGWNSKDVEEKHLEACRKMFKGESRADWERRITELARQTLSESDASMLKAIKEAAAKYSRVMVIGGAGHFARDKVLKALNGYSNAAILLPR